MSIGHDGISGLVETMLKLHETANSLPPTAYGKETKIPAKLFGSDSRIAGDWRTG
jgi:hypothetical protein